MKSILVPVDCSAATPRVLDLARELAKAFGARLHLMHVWEIVAPVPTGPLGYGAVGVPEIVPMTAVPEAMGQAVVPNEAHKAKLAEWKEEISRAGLPVTLHEPTGSVLDEILKQATAANVDLIVMGTHGHGAMYNLLVGSVTEGVLKRATQPVLLVPSRVDA
jgi:nucleotide-binding universal stress UspA family protein